jgi:hypothetical protein
VLEACAGRSLAEGMELAGGFLACFDSAYRQMAAVTCPSASPEQA